MGIHVASKDIRCLRRSIDVRVACSTGPLDLGSTREDAVKQTYVLTHVKDTKNTRVFNLDIKLEGRDIAFIVYVPREFKMEGDKLTITLDDSAPTETFEP